MKIDEAIDDLYTILGQHNGEYMDYASYEAAVDNLNIISNFVIGTRWIPVSERLPDSQEEVLIVTLEKLPYINKMIRHVVRACHIEPNKVDASDWDDYEDVTYAEEADMYFVNEGWFEITDYYGDMMYLYINDHVTHWMPLPEPPETTREDAGHWDGIAPLQEVE